METVFILLISSQLWLGIAPNERAARISFQAMEDNATITGFFTNHLATPLEANYQLTYTRKDTKGNQSNNQQSGHFIAPSGTEIQVPSVVKVNYSQTDYYKAQLIISDAQGNVIARDTLEEGKKKD